MLTHCGKRWRDTSMPLGGHLVPLDGKREAGAGRVSMDSIPQTFGSGPNLRASRSRTAGEYRPSWLSSSRQRQGNRNDLGWGALELKSGLSRLLPAYQGLATTSQAT